MTDVPTLFDVDGALRQPTNDAIRAAMRTLGITDLIHLEDAEGKMMLGYMADGSLVVDAYPMEPPAPLPPISEIVGAILRHGGESSEQGER